jgi:hypothetical protein
VRLVWALAATAGPLARLPVTAGLGRTGGSVTIRAVRAVRPVRSIWSVMSAVGAASVEIHRFNSTRELKTAPSLH